MRKINKKGFEISINMIVIVIIAVVTLFIALGFITGVFQKLLPAIPFPQVDAATASSPITFNPAVMERGKKTGMSISFYNNELADVPSTVLPMMSCAEMSEIKISASGLNVKVGEAKKYEAIVTIPSNTPSGPYSCTLTISSTEKTFVMDVK
jgi:hypothetical protein